LPAIFRVRNSYLHSESFGMISISFLLAVVIACTKTGDSTAPSTGISYPAIDKTVMLKLVNDVRKKGCNCGDKYFSPAPPLTWNDQLEKAAVDHSNDMFQNKYFSHKDKKGNSAGKRIKNAGYNWSFYGENIAEGYSDEKAAVAGWLKSPGHCGNIMSKVFKEMGAAKAGSYWTQTFGSK